VIHAATIEVDEHGTIAAAATAMQLDGSAEPEAAKVVVRADRPFLYLVRHEPTGAVLFVGRVLDPAPVSSG
jgi:serpin B